MRQLEGTPLVIFRTGETWGDYAGRADVLLIGAKERDGQTAICMPQFDIEAVIEDDTDSDEFGRVVEEALRQLTVFYSALRELPPEYVNEVEQAQMELLERVVLPWLFAHMGRSPSYLTLPPIDTHLVSA